MGLINRKREDTSLTTIAMAVLVTNIFGSFKRAISETEMGGRRTFLRSNIWLLLKSQIR